MSDWPTAISSQQEMERSVVAEGWVLEAIVGPETGGLRFI